MWQDLREGYRGFARNPAFTAIAIISIALGTGANVAMFSAADALLLKPLPVTRPTELVTVGSRIEKGFRSTSSASYPDYVDIRDRARSFDGLLAFTSRRTGCSFRPGQPPRLKVITLVSDNFFRLLGVPPEIGRDFLPAERLSGGNPVVVLSYATWQAEFASDRDALGSTVRIAGVDFTIVGVAPERFTGLDSYVADAAYVPLSTLSRLMNSPTVDPLTARDNRTLTLKGRLKPGTSLQSARAELAVIASDLQRAHTDTNANHTLTAQTELEIAFERRPLDSSLVFLLTILSVAVLCVSCANVAGLLASRAPVRAREMALRLAIGASRIRLVRQLLTESGAIACVGSAGGIAVGYVGIILLSQIEFPSEIVSVPVMQLDRRSMSYSVALAAVSALLFGLWPAIQATRVNLSGALKSGDAGAAARHPLMGRHALVAIQVALALVMLTVAVFTFQVFRRELGRGPGFHTSHIAKLTVDTDQARYAPEQSIRFFDELVEHAQRLDGVQFATVTSAMPLWSGDMTSIVPGSYDPPDAQRSVHPYSNIVGEAYFDTLGIPLLAGRAFRPSDDADSRRVAIVNETLAQRYWPGQDAIGRRFRMTGPEGPWVEIVGLAKTTTYVYSGEPAREMVYFPFRQVPSGEMVVLVRTSVESATLLAPLREMVWKMDGDVLVYDVQTMERFYDARTTRIARVIMVIIGGIGAMGMALAMVGLYGLVSYAASRRTREIGIRLAVGATHGRIVRMILRQGMTPACIGLVTGLALAAATARVLPGLVLVGHQYDATTFVVVAAVLVAVTLFAAYVPANRAARTNPMVALRCD